MLPKELSAYSVRKGFIYPHFQTYEQLAKIIIEVFYKSIGKKFCEIKDECSSFEISENYKVIRGYFHILAKNYCQWTESFSDSKELRKFLFENGPVLSKSERQKIIKLAEEKFGIDSPDEFMWADKQEEKRLQRFESVTSDQLVRIYNLSLIQSILLNSEKVRITLRGAPRKILYLIKKMGLMYTSEEENGVCILELTGPVSCVKETTRYGFEFAKIFKILLKAESFTLEAKVGNNILKICDNPELFPEIEKEEPVFDSSLEEQLFHLLKDAFPSLSIHKEIDIVKSGRNIFIPDFCLELAKNKFYVELVGFWTEDYLNKKMQKIRDSKIDLTIIASEGFCLSDMESLSSSKDIILFKNKLPFLEIIKKIKEKIQRYSVYTPIKIERFKKVVEVAREMGVSEDLLCERLKGEGYSVGGGYVFSPDFLREIEYGIKEGMNFEEVKRILADYALPPEVVEAMGYRFEWKRMLPPEAVLKRTRTTNE